MERDPIDHLARPADCDDVIDVMRMSTEDRELLVKNLTEYLLCLSADELNAASSRVGDLYWKAQKLTSPFNQTHVDLFAIATLTALEAQPPTANAVTTASRLRNNRRIAANYTRSVNSPLDNIGPNSLQ